MQGQLAHSAQTRTRTNGWKAPAESESKISLRKISRTAMFLRAESELLVPSEIPKFGEVLVFVSMGSHLGRFQVNDPSGLSVFSGGKKLFAFHEGGVPGGDRSPEQVLVDYIFSDLDLGHVDKILSTLEEHQGSADTAVEANSEFLPSQELLKLVWDGAKQYASQIERSEWPKGLDRFLNRLTNLEKQRLFSEVFFDLIAALLYRQSNSTERRISVARGGEFELVYITAFPSLFPFWPTEIKEFQGRLFEDLASFLRNGGKVVGGWGKLVMRNNDIVAEVNSNRSDLLEGDWTPARSLRR